MSVTPVRAEISINTLTVVATEQALISGFYEEPPAAVPVPDGQLYMWTVFFKVDGDTASIDSDFNLTGTATVVGTPGNQGDLPAITGTGVAAASISIPIELAQWRTILAPIPVTSIPGMSVAGIIGAVVVIAAKSGTPANAIAAGHNTLNSSIQSGLNAIVTTLSVKNPSVTNDQVQGLATGVQSAVKSAIEGSAGWWNLAGVPLGTTTEDTMLGACVYYVSASDLAASPATGIAVANGYPATGTTLQYTFTPTPGGAPVTLTCTLGGALVGDPKPVSLARVLTRMGQTSTRTAMNGQTGSVTAWVDMAP